MMKQRGFTLIEIAIVLVIVAVLLGYTMSMLPIQQELKQYRQADQEMEKIIDSLYAFAQAKGYLPCPAWTNNINSASPTETSDGFECRDVNGASGVCKDGVSPPLPASHTCDVWYGFVPGKTLGLNGNYSAINHLLLDPWGMPYRYQVSNANLAIPPGTSFHDFVIVGEMSRVTMTNLAPNLTVCNTATSISSTDCGITGAAARTVANKLPAVVLSTGKDGAKVPLGGSVQNENWNNSATNRVFVKTSYNDSDTAAHYDDRVKWIVPNVLYSKMIDAGHLP